MILYWSIYRLYICQSILSRQSFASFMSRYLAAEAVASYVPCLTIGFFRYVFFFFFLGRYRWLCCSYQAFELLSALDASTWNVRKLLLFIGRVST